MAKAFDPKETDSEKFERIKRALGKAMLSPKAEGNQILRDFEWVVAYASTLQVPVIVKREGE